MSEYVPQNLRKLVEERASFHCEYCLLPSLFSGHPFCIDHIFPTSKKGKTILENLAFSCQNCNGAKYDKIEGLDPLSQLLIPLFNPRTQIWTRHFNWNQDNSLIIGLTPTGRATVETLKMNLERVQNLRLALNAYGVFPPK